MQNSNLKIQKPFLKWVGGKTQIIRKIINKFPKNINNYYEIFLGGGSVLFALLSMREKGLINIQNKIFAYDLNSDLIDVYKTIQNKNCKDELFNCLFIFINEYDKIKKIDKKDLPNILNRKPKNKNEALKCKENYYYWIRSKYNSLIKNNSQKQKDIIEKSAMFIFLNKTGFRGMYRVGPNGFNIPYGNYKKTPKFFTKNEFNAISDLIKDVKFICCHFNESFENIRKGDFIYLDPPYAPVNKKSFVKYTKNGFTYENHLELFGKIKKISQIDGVKLLMSNSKVKLVEDNFTNNGLDVDNIFNIEDVIVRRAINSKNPAAKAKEVLIWN